MLYFSGLIDTFIFAKVIDNPNNFVYAPQEPNRDRITDEIHKATKPLTAPLGGSQETYIVWFALTVCEQSDAVEAQRDSMTPNVTKPGVSDEWSPKLYFYVDSFIHTSNNDGKEKEVINLTVVGILEQAKPGQRRVRDAMKNSAMSPRQASNQEKSWRGPEKREIH
ncbi:hypothetical protein STEG23_017350, partial [Scotinomys teguina]